MSSAKASHPGPSGRRPRHWWVWRGPSEVRRLLLSVAAVFLVELGLMLALQQESPGLPPLAADLLDGAVLTVIVLPVLYFLLFRPLLREVAEHERLLREADVQRERFQAVVENAPAGIAVLRPPAFVYDLVNPVYQGIAPDLPMVGRTVGEVFPDLASEVLPLLEGVIRTGEPYHAVDRRFRIRRSPEMDPEDVSFTFAYEPMRDASGRVEAVLVLVVETTDQVLARADRERLLAELEATLEAAPAGVVTCDQTGRIVRMNEAAVQIMGCGPADLALPLSELFAKLSFESADGRPIAIDELPGFRALRGEKVSGVAMALRRSGGGGPGGGPGNQADDHRTWIYDGAGPIRARDGTILGAVASFVDVTELREAQEQAQTLLAQQVDARKHNEALADTAQRQAAELQAVLDNMVDAVFVVDKERRLSLTNAAATKLFGLASFSDVRDVPAEFPALLNIRHPDSRLFAPEETATARALGGETVASLDQVVYDAGTGQDRRIQASAAPIRGAEGTVVGAVVVSRDVTELTELDRLKDQFISIAAHELKTPVAAVQGYTQALLRLAGDVSSRWRPMLTAIDRGTHRIDAIVLDLLDISRLEAGQLQLTTERVDLPELVAEVVERRGLVAHRHQIRVVRADPAVVQANRDRLEQVLVELLDNAVTYSPAGGSIEVAVGLRDDEAVLSVSDHGVGIPKEKQQRIFERFYRAHTGTPYDYGGMGVGLYISREVVRRLGGRMWFESSDGVGSTFSFSLPLASEGDGSNHEAAAPPEDEVT